MRVPRVARFLVVVIVLAVISAAAESKSYQTGKLLDVEVKVYDNDRADYYYITVQLGQMTYVGEYRAAFLWSYEPKEWVVNDPIEVRFEKDKMFIKRPNGKELKTKVVKRIRTEG